MLDATGLNTAINAALAIDPAATKPWVWQRRDR